MTWQEKIKNIKCLKQERGSILVLTVILLPIMFAFLGFGYDFGNLYMHKARLQNVADAAALAGARAYLDSQATDNKDEIDGTVDRANGKLKTDSSTEDDSTTTDSVGRNTPNGRTDPDVYKVEDNPPTKDRNYSKHKAADEAADAYIYHNIVNLGGTVYSDKWSHYAINSDNANPKTFYRIGLYEEVPLYFLPIIKSIKSPQIVRAGAIALMVPGGTTSNGGSLKLDTTKTFSMFDNLFTYSSSLYTERANTNDGTVHSSFTGDIVYTHLNSLTEDGNPSDTTFYDAQTDDGGTDTHQYNHLYQTAGVINDPRINTLYDTAAYMEAFRSKLGSPHIDVKDQTFNITGEETINNFCEYYINGKSDRYRKEYPNDYYLLNETGDYYTVTINNVKYKVCYHPFPNSNILVRCAKNDKDSKFYLLNDSNQMTTHYIGRETIVVNEYYSYQQEISDLTENQYKELGITYYNLWSDFQQKQNSGNTSNIYHIGRVTIDGQVQNITVNINQPLKGDEDTPIYLIIDDDMEYVLINNTASTTRRPVIVVYNGTNDVYFYVNGNEFKGTLYAPNAEVEINPGSNATFFGNIIAHRIFMQASDESSWVQTNYLQNDSDIQNATGNIKNKILNAYNSLTNEEKNNLLDEVSSGLDVDKNNLVDLNWYNNLTLAEKKALYVKWKNLYDNETDLIKKDFLWLWNGAFTITEGEGSTENTDEVLRLINFRTDYQDSSDTSKVVDPFVYLSLEEEDAY